MRRVLQYIFRPFFIWLAEKFSAAPRQLDVFKSLGLLYNDIRKKITSRGIIIPFDPKTDGFIIFSDQHKGTKTFDDDFKNNAANYLAALTFYNEQRYRFINLGDAEELWKNTADKVIKSYPDVLAAEAIFHIVGRYYRTFGNHDLLWKNSLDVLLYLKSIFISPLPVYEGVILRAAASKDTVIDIFCTHGHQGDLMSDNNALSTWLIAHVWAPIQRFLQVNVNTPANDFTLRNKHNRLMYEWSSYKKNLLLVTGHTHKPVFASGKYTGTAAHKINTAKPIAEVKPCYFNTGCCCFNDGDITGIEISGGFIRLVKWCLEEKIPTRKVLEEKLLTELAHDL